MKTNKKGKLRGVRLNKPQDVRRLLSRLINQSLRDEIDTDLLRAVTYSCSIILKSLEVGELADKISELEEKVL